MFMARGQQLATTVATRGEVTDPLAEAIRLIREGTVRYDDAALYALRDGLLRQDQTRYKKHQFVIIRVIG